MAEAITLSGFDIPVHVRRNARAKRLTLRLSSRDGTPTVTAPPHTPVKIIAEFVESNENWLRKQSERLPAHLAISDIDSIPFLGLPHRLQQDRIRTVRHDGDTLTLPARAPEAALKAFLKTRARSALVPAAEKYATALGESFKRITLRDTRSRWGSCSSEGNLMFSWRLIMAPPAVLDYVAAHEVSHLREMNHSPAFWNIVADLCPDYRSHRNWLKTEGVALQRIRF